MTIAADARIFQLPFPLFRSLLEAVAADRPAPETADRLRKAGYDCGATIHTLLEEHLSAQTAIESVHSLPASDFWESFGSFWASLGWGTLEHRALHAGVDELGSEEWAEAGSGAAAEVGCQLTTGLLSDVLSRVAGEDVAVLEVECRGRGGSRCRFLIGGPAALEAVYEQLRAGVTPERALAAIV